MPDSARYMVRYGGVPGLDILVRRHPRLLSPQSGSLCALEFGLNSYRRSIVVGYRERYPVGLIELFDNNPIVCAETVCLPTPAATLALLAIDPLFKAGLATRPVRVSCSSPCELADLDPFLNQLDDRVNLLRDTRVVADEGCVAVEVELAVDQTAEDIEELYDDAYGRSLLVMKAGEAHPLAASYAVVKVGDSAVVRLASKIEGKAGAAQVIQALNVMAGFEDSLGIG